MPVFDTDTVHEYVLFCEFEVVCACVCVCVLVVGGGTLNIIPSFVFLINPPLSLFKLNFKSNNNF